MSGGDLTIAISITAGRASAKRRTTEYRQSTPGSSEVSFFQSGCVRDRLSTIFMSSARDKVASAKRCVKAIAPLIARLRWVSVKVARGGASFPGDLVEGGRERHMLGEAGKQKMDLKLFSNKKGEEEFYERKRGRGKRDRDGIVVGGYCDTYEITSPTTVILGFDTSRR